jgi:membrane-bound serine protease (ClpP class)
MIWLWLIILLGAALALFLLELFVPSGGILAILGAGCMIGAIMLCFKIDRWLGAGVLAASVLLAPFAVAWGVTLWQKSYFGRRMIITETVGQMPKAQVLIGSVGIALTEMRPMGEVEIGDAKIEAQSEMGMIIPAGRCVQVLSMAGGIATVRELKETT